MCSCLTSGSSGSPCRRRKACFAGTWSACCGRCPNWPTGALREPPRAALQSRMLRRSQHWPPQAGSGTKYVIDSLVDTARPSFCTHFYTIQGISIMALSCQVPAKLQWKITPQSKTISNYLLQIDFWKTYWYKVQLINFTCELAEAYRLSRVRLYAADSINTVRTDLQYFHGFADKKMSSNEHSLFSLISSAANREF